MNKSDELHIVLGATGGLGNAVVRELVAQGKKVRATNRSGKADVPDSVEMVKCEASDKGQVREVFKGAAVVYHCVNAPYTDWPKVFPPINEAILEGAAAAGAKLIVGDNLYMYGPVKEPMREDMPAVATTRKGQVRAEMAEKFLQAHKSGKVRVAIARGADFYGPGITNSALGERVFQAVLEGKSIDVLGNIDMPHTYTFIDDFAKGVVLLGEKEEALGEIWHIPNAETLSTRQFLERVFKVAGKKSKIRVAPRALISILAWFNPIMREIKEMLYQFEQPFVVDHSKFANAFAFEITPHEEAIGRTLEWFRQRISKDE